MQKGNFLIFFVFWVKVCVFQGFDAEMCVFQGFNLEVFDFIYFLVFLEKDTFSRF